MKITIDVSDERLNSLLHGHGGEDSPWLHELSGNLIKDGQFFVHFDQEDDEEGAGTGKRTITREDVQHGLALMAQYAPYQWGEFMQENDDTVTFDVALQFIIFGREIYG